MFNQLRTKGFDILVSNHAEAILEKDFPEQVKGIGFGLEQFEYSNR